MEEILNTDQNKNFFQKNINIVICCIFCTALWGSAFPCVKLGYELFNISVDDIFSKNIICRLEIFLSGNNSFINNSLYSKEISKIKKRSYKISCYFRLYPNYIRIYILLYRAFVCVWI